MRLYNTLLGYFWSLLFLAIALLPLSLYYDREPQSFVYIHHLYSCVAGRRNRVSYVPRPIASSLTNIHLLVAAECTMHVSSNSYST